MKPFLHIIFITLMLSVLSMASEGVFLPAVISFLLSDSAPVTLPLAPTSVAVTLVNQTSDELHIVWHDNSNNESGFVIYRSESSNVTTKIQVGTTGVNSTAFNDTSLNACKTYYYWVTAKNSAGEALSSTSGNAKTAPAAPTNFLAYKGPGIYQIHLDWDAQNCAASYNIYDLTKYTNSYEINTSGITATEFTIDRVLPTYKAIFYRISSVDADGHEGALSCRVVSTSPQAGATSQSDSCMAAVAWSVDPYIQNVWGSWNNYTDRVIIGWNSVPLTWNASGVAQSYAQEYYVQISVDQTNWYDLNNNGSVFSHQSNPANGNDMYLDLSVSYANQVYYFRLYTRYYYDINGDGTIDYAQTSTPVEVSARTAATGSITTTLPAPWILTSNYYPNRIMIGWGEINGANGYRLYRVATHDGISSSPIYSGTAVEYWDESITPYTNYWYYVCAVNSSGVCGTNSIHMYGNATNLNWDY